MRVGDHAKLFIEKIVEKKIEKIRNIHGQRGQIIKLFHARLVLVNKRGQHEIQKDRKAAAQALEATQVNSEHHPGLGLVYQNIFGNV